MKRDDQSRRRSTMRFYLLAVFALTMLLGLPCAAPAQSQWSSPDANGNIYNTNSGKVGIGATGFDPWPSSFKVLGLNNNSGFTIAAGNTSGNALHITDRAYFNGTNWIYSVSSLPITNYYQGDGVHAFRVAPGGMAGNTVTWTNALFINNSGKVGIGTISPVSKLDVSGAVYSSSASTNTVFSGVVGTTNANFIGSGGYWALRTATNNSYNLDVYNGGSPLAALTVVQSGNVGIGATTPSAKLDVNGNTNINGDLNVTGNINARYQDVAEWVPATHALAAGTVVVLNPSQSNQVMASASAYDTRVAGVISERPGLALGEAGKDKVLVATTGRVKVRVDASRAAIHIGDLLVTSDVEGAAMKSEPVELEGVKLHRPGTLIGKALEPLEKGTGEILVLLSLQ